MLISSADDLPATLEESRTTEAETFSFQPGIPHCQKQFWVGFRVNWRGLGGKIWHAQHICNHIHPLKGSLVKAEHQQKLVLKPKARNGLAVQTCRWISYARGSVLYIETDKPCLVHSHNHEHARTQERQRGLSPTKPLLGSGSGGGC